MGWQQLVKTSLEHCQRSFGVECSDRIEPHGAQRRDVAGGERDGGKHNGIGDGSINSQAREQQGCGGKKRHHFHGESAHGKRRRENVIQRFRVEDGKLRIDGLDLRAHLRGDGGGIDLSAQKEGQILGGALVDIEIDLRNAEQESVIEGNLL